jgi:hypothetical protein
MSCYQTLRRFFTATRGELLLERLGDYVMYSVHNRRFARRPVQYTSADSRPGEVVYSAPGSPAVWGELVDASKNFCKRLRDSFFGVVFRMYYCAPVTSM